jgi:uncharacterized protein (TIGR01777 family)
MKLRSFRKRSRIQAPVEEVFRWHANVGAIERLSPPWDPLEMVSKKGGIAPGARVVMKLRAGPLPVMLTWEARHTAYEENRFFEDRQVKGPFAHWVHRHIFEPAENDPQASYLEDRIEYALRLGSLGDVLGAPMVAKRLAQIFHFRHDTTAYDLSDHLGRQDPSELTFLISGCSGTIGSVLIPFLSTGGHRILRLVRRPALAPDEVSWDPMAGRIDQRRLAAQPIHAVIHLAGENIGRQRWRPKVMQRIMASREMGTSLIAESVARLTPPPKVFINASAIGYYGHRGDEVMDEDACFGGDFISEVCHRWEEATAAAVASGIRTAYLRIGVALSPLGGALKRLLPMFYMGLGAKIASGQQYMSWIDMDDVIGSIYHVVNTPNLKGPVNIVAPHPVTNHELTHTLAQVLGRKAPWTIPKGLIKLTFGQMGEEVLLSSTRVSPLKLLESGYRFRFPELRASLEHLLGKVAL